VGGAGDGASTFRIRLATQPVAVDARLDDAAWVEAEAILLLYEWLPGDNVAPPVETRCMLSYDADQLYLACHARDPEPGAIRAHVTDRDRPFGDDHIVLLLDPFNDQRRGFQFRINPYGVQMDAIFSALEGFEDFSWDAIWKSAGRITEDGYIVEAAIPFKSLRFPRGADVQTWGLSLERSWPRTNRHRIRSHRTVRGDACLLCQINKLVGIQGARPGADVEVTPTLTGSRTDRQDAAQFPTGELRGGTADFEPGVTARWGITPNIILNGTLSPDFSHVEADVAQLEVNQRFALFYPERRPFFLEGADIFLTPVGAVFTRTVVDPRAGLKLTAKEGRNIVGVFAAQDRVNTLLFPANQGTGQALLDQTVDAAVVRFRRDVGQASTLGALYTGRSGEDGYRNHVTGADGFLRPYQAATLRFQYLHSWTEYPAEVAASSGQPRGGFEGEAWNAVFQHFSRNWLVQGFWDDRTPGFRADAGFVPRVDYRRVGGSAQRVLWGTQRHWFTQLFVGAGGDVIHDHDGRLTDRAFGPNLTYVGPLQSRVDVDLSFRRELYQDEYFDLVTFLLQGQAQPSGDLSLTLTAFVGEAVDLANARKGNRLLFQPRAELRLGRALNLNLSHSLDRLTRDGGTVYTANLAQARVLYHFGVRSFARAILQYRWTERDPALHVFPTQAKQDALFTQLLFSYKVNPQTVVFLGYSDNRLGLEPCLICDPGGNTPLDLTTTDRTFFIKLGYAWRL
jgi:hypothetical protein